MMSLPEATPPRRGWCRFGVVPVVLVLHGVAGVSAVRAAPPAPASQPAIAVRDAEATRAFRAGRWAEAAAAFLVLYEETRHPIYLRNIARCHQMRREPREALAYFQKYTEARPDMPTSERREIDVYVAEMQRLEAVLDEPSPARAVALPPLEPPSNLVEPPAGLRASPVANPQPSPPFYKTWWFWTLAGAAAAAGGALTYHKLSETELPACRMGFTCMRRE